MLMLLLCLLNSYAFNTYYFIILFITYCICLICVFLRCVVYVSNSVLYPMDFPSLNNNPGLQATFSSDCAMKGMI